MDLIGSLALLIKILVKSIFYDSFGQSRQVDHRIELFVNKIIGFYRNKLNYINIITDDNKISHQNDNYTCGTHCVNFLIKMLVGESFDFFCQNKILNTTIQNYHEKYLKF